MQVDFNLDWLAYKNGFGHEDSEFWIGNNFLHTLTNQKNYELKIKINDYEKGSFDAHYK